jgi:GTPase involved in cell partitioning and DNA repair
MSCKGIYRLVNGKLIDERGLINMDAFVEEDEALAQLSVVKSSDEDEFKKYEVVLKCKVKAVVYAKGEQDAIDKAQQNKTEKEFEWQGSESVRELSDDDTRKIIKNIVGSMKERLDDKKFCPECEEYKPSKGFKKGRNDDEPICADCRANK